MITLLLLSTTCPFWIIFPTSYASFMGSRQFMESSLSQHQFVKVSIFFLTETFPLKICVSVKNHCSFALERLEKSSSWTSLAISATLLWKRLLEASTSQFTLVISQTPKLLL